MSIFFDSRSARSTAARHHIPSLSLFDWLYRLYSACGFRRPGRLRDGVDDAVSLPCHLYCLGAFQETDASDYSKADYHSHGRLPNRSEFLHSQSAMQPDGFFHIESPSKHYRSHMRFCKPAIPNRHIRRLTDPLSTRNVRYVFLRTWLFLSKKVLPARRRFCCSGKTNLTYWGARKKENPPIGCFA